MKKLYSLILFSVLLHLPGIAQTTLDTALNFVAKDIYGNRLELFEFLDDDKIAVIDFFNTSCGPCQTYAPDMQASYTDFGENQGNVIFMGISKGDDNAMVAQFDSIFGITYPSISGSQGGGNAIHTDYNILGTPTVIVITPDRAIVEKHIWEPTRDNINAAVMNAGGILAGTESQSRILQDDLQLFPNPASLETQISFVSAGKSYSVRLFDLTGKEMQSTVPKYFPGGRQIILLKIDKLPKGLYFVKVIEEGHMLGISTLVKI